MKRERSRREEREDESRQSARGESSDLILGDGDTWAGIFSYLRATGRCGGQLRLESFAFRERGSRTRKEMGSMGTRQEKNAWIGLAPKLGLGV